MRSGIAVAAISAIALINPAYAATEHEKILFNTFDTAISRYEFDWEHHQVVTDDGYILSMFRLTGPTPTSKLHFENHSQRKVASKEEFFPDRIREKLEKEEEQKTMI